MPPPILRYGLDPTGINPDNLVALEPHTLAHRRIRAIAPVEGAFFGDSLAIRDNTSGQILTKGIHYVPQEYYRTPSELYGKAIYGIVLIIDPSISSDVSITYQVLGGIYNGKTETLKHLLEQYRDDGSELEFYDVVGRPDAYDPTPHFMSLSEGVHFEYLVFQLERIRNAILWSDSVTYQDIYTYIQNLLRDIDARLVQSMDKFITPMLYDFRRNFTKAYIGLDLVDNLRTATQEEGARAALPETKINDFSVRRFIALEALVAFKDKLYEYMVSKEETNLGRIQAVFKDPRKQSILNMVNGATVSFLSKAEAVSSGGFDPNAYPPGIPENMRITIVKLTNNRNNRGGLFLAYYNDGSQAWMGRSATGTLTEEFSWKKFLFTEDIQSFIDLLSSHIQNTNNPHLTTKDQVGLGRVENLPVITREEILCLQSTRKYMTFDAFLLFMKAFMIGKNGSAADPGDESGEPLDNCQIIYCPCSPCGCGGDDGGSPPSPTPPPCPAYGTLQNWVCRGFDKIGIYNNGTCGTYESVMGTNSPECGYVPPPACPQSGSMVSWYCEGTTKWGKYADGNCGTYPQVMQANSPECGYTTPVPTPSNPNPPPPTSDLRISLALGTSSISVGNSTTATSSVTGMIKGNSYKITLQMKNNTSSTFTVIDTKTHTATTNETSVGNGITNTGSMTGRVEYKATVEAVGDSSKKAESTVQALTFTGDKNVLLKVNGNTSSTSMTAGQAANIEVFLNNFPVNQSVSVRIIADRTAVGLSPAMYTGSWNNVTTDSTGRAVFTTSATGNVPTSTSGVVRFYAEGRWSSGSSPFDVPSNNVNVTMTPTGGHQCPAAGSVVTTRCSGATLHEEIADGNCKTTLRSTLNSPKCYSRPPDYFWKPVPFVFMSNVEKNPVAIDGEVYVQYFPATGDARFYWEYMNESSIITVRGGVSNGNGQLVGGELIVFGGVIMPVMPMHINYTGSPSGSVPSGSAIIRGYNVASQGVVMGTGSSPRFVDAEGNNIVHIQKLYINDKTTAPPPPPPGPTPPSPTPPNPPPPPSAPILRTVPAIDQQSGYQGGTAVIKFEPDKGRITAYEFVERANSGWYWPSFLSDHESGRLFRGLRTPNNANYPSSSITNTMGQPSMCYNNRTVEEFNNVNGVFFSYQQGAAAGP